MEYSLADRMQNLEANAIREIFKLLQRPNIISFAGGMPSASSFPSTELAHMAAGLLDRHGPALLQYGATEGYLPLRESAAEYLKGKEMHVTADDLFVISGGQQGIDLIAKTFINPGDCVLVEAPTYLAAIHIMKTYQAKMVAVRTDEDGICPDDLEEKMKAHKPKLLYLVPTFQNPTGITLCLERRREVVRLCQRYGVVVIEDDPYRELRYHGKALPAMYTFDDARENVVHLASFSKIISPGLRVGVAVAPKEILRKMVIGKQATDVHTSNLSQALVDAYLRSGELPGHIREINASYRVQLDTMLQMIHEHFPAEAKCTRPQGGLFIWCELPESVHTPTLMKKALEQNVAFIPGTDFYCNGRGDNTLRLNFSASTPEKIVSGMRILAGVLKDALVGRL